MYKKKKILAIIPARGGSVGIPKKNIKLLSGKPLIYWTLNEVKKSNFIDRIIVSTDNQAIANIASQCGAEVPFLRPKALSTSKAKMIDVVLHVLKWLNSRGDLYDLVILLQPTSPLRSSFDLDESVKLFFSRKSIKSVISVCQIDHPVQWMGRLSKNNNMKDFVGRKGVKLNRQDLPVFYRINGAIYLVDIDYLLKNKSFLSRQSYAYVMPRERSVDIDDYFDFEFADFLKMRKKGKD
jgi:N-acylneuraminate cytidylyltransferase/CMP-N,N'-diacetyllegionaminic acid synthase